MGARIAAHFANAGFPVDLLDIVLPDQPKRNAAALAGIENASKQRPVAFFTAAAKALITPGNFEDDLGRVGRCEWIVEAVAENLEIKRSLWRRVAAVRAPGSIVSTNTSGIPLARISDGFDSEFQQHFLGTHFFNPPRYLHLAEVIAGPETQGDVLDWVAAFCDLHLGKGVVPCKDTPNFIGNRIGCFFGAKVGQLTEEFDFTVEEVDALTGPLIGLPKSASFRLIDIIGLDVWVHVLRNLYEAAPLDPARELYRVPAVMQQMMERGWLGEKRGQGFYQRVGKEKRDLGARPQDAGIPAGAKAEISARGRRTRHRGSGTAPARTGRVRRSRRAVSVEAVSRLRALLGAHGAGDLRPHRRTRSRHALGLRLHARTFRVVGRARRAAKPSSACERKAARFPTTWSACWHRARSASMKSRIATASPGTRYFDLNAGGLRASLEKRPGVIALRDLKRARGVVKSNPGASLVDLGDGVLCLEFHSKMNCARRRHGADGGRRVRQGRTRASRRWWWPTTARTSASAPT